VITAALEVMIGVLKAGQRADLPETRTVSVKATAARNGVKQETAEKIQAIKSALRSLATSSKL